MMKRVYTSKIPRRAACLALAFAPLMHVYGQEADTLATEMRDVQVSVMRSHRGMGIETKELVGKGDLIRAACCNLGESFTKNLMFADVLCPV